MTMASHGKLKISAFLTSTIGLPGPAGPAGATALKSAGLPTSTPRSGGCGTAGPGGRGKGGIGKAAIVKLSMEFYQKKYIECIMISIFMISCKASV
jgi:hypothetical protein